jgi:hypothetical protein
VGLTLPTVDGVFITFCFKGVFRVKAESRAGSNSIFNSNKSLPVKKRKIENVTVENNEIEKYTNYSQQQCANWYSKEVVIFKANLSNRYI